jgi:hypothetical protein
MIILDIDYYIKAIKLKSKLCINRRRKKAMIGEKSKIMPGPPKGDRWMTERMGLNMGSVNAYNICTSLFPLAMGNQERITRAKIAMYKKVQK